MIESTAGPNPPAPAHNRGRLNDRSFPTPRRFRRHLSFVLDIGVHSALTFDLGVLTQLIDIPAGDRSYSAASIFGLLGIYAAVSITDRVVGQSIWHTTLGKAACGLVVVDPRTGASPGLRRLLGAWMWCSIWPLWLLEICPDNPEDYLMSAVRRCDLPDPKSPPPPVPHSTLRPGRASTRPPGPPPPDGPALDWPPTRRAQRRYIAKYLLLPTAVVLLSAIGIGFHQTSRVSDHGSGPVEWIVKLMVAALIVAALGTGAVINRRRWLRNPWIVCSVAWIGPADGEHVTLSAVDDCRTVLIAPLSDVRSVIDDATEYVWFSGRSRRDGIVAPVGGAKLCPVTDRATPQALAAHLGSTEIAAIDPSTPPAQVEK